MAGMCNQRLARLLGGFAAFASSLSLLASSCSFFFAACWSFLRHLQASICNLRLAMVTFGILINVAKALLELSLHCIDHSLAGIQMELCRPLVDDRHSSRCRFHVSRLIGLDVLPHLEERLNHGTAT